MCCPFEPHSRPFLLLLDALSSSSSSFGGRVCVFDKTDIRLMHMSRIDAATKATANFAILTIVTDMKY